MDAYAKTWLQFVFPAYVFTLVGAVITLVHYFTMVARLFGSNPISVLATLFLLSYTKLLRTIITTFSLTILEYPNELELVWIFDGNIQVSHHFFISLFLTTGLAQVLFISYTLLLLMGPWIQTHSKRRVFSWINNYWVKPFLDAYQAPFRNTHCYWVGVVLVVHCLHYVVFAFNVLGDPSVNLLFILFGLAIVIRFMGKIIMVLRHSWSFLLSQPRDSC